MVAATDTRAIRVAAVSATQRRVLEQCGAEPRLERPDLLAGCLSGVTLSAVAATARAVTDVSPL